MAGKYRYLLLLFPILLAMRVYKLDQTGLYDYDSAKNYLIAGEIAQLNLENLYNHRSPTLHLINGVIRLITDNYLVFEWIHAIIQTIAILLFAGFVQQRLKLNQWQALLLGLMAGSSLVLINSGRYMAIEPLTLLLSILALVFYADWLEDRNIRAYYRTIICYALLTTVNYKSLFLFPVFIVLEFLLSSKVYTKRQLIITSILLAKPFLGYSIVGMFTNHGFFHYIKTHAVTLFSKEHNPLMTGGTFDWQLDFYIRYVFSFENPLLFLGLIWIIWDQREALSRFRSTPNWLTFSIVFTLVYLVLISITRKAPRALLFIDLFLYLYFFLFILRVFKNRIITYSLMLLSVAYSLVQADRHIYAYADSNYAELANQLEEQGIQNVALYVDAGPAVFLPEEVEWEVLLEPDFEGYEAVVITDYLEITGFEKPKLDGAVLIELKEPQLGAPLLALEHAEFTRESFDHMMEISQEIRDREVNVRVILSGTNH